MFHSDWYFTEVCSSVEWWSVQVTAWHRKATIHDDVIKWKQFSRYWPFVQGIHRSPVNSQHKGQWRGALMFSLICAWINGWVNNDEASDLRRHRAHYDVIVMCFLKAMFLPNTRRLTTSPSLNKLKALRWRHNGDDSVSNHQPVYLGSDQSKYQSSASLAFVWGIHRGPVNSPHKWPVTWKMFPFDDVIMGNAIIVILITSSLAYRIPRFLSTKPLPAPKYVYYQMSPCGQTLAEFQSKYKSTYSKKMLL